MKLVHNIYTVNIAFDFELKMMWYLLPQRLEATSPLFTSSLRPPEPLVLLVLEVEDPPQPQLFHTASRGCSATVMRSLVHALQ